MRKLLRFPYRLLWILPLAFLVGAYAPEWLFLAVLVLALPVIIWQLSDFSYQAGYWKAQVQVAEVMSRVMEDDETTESKKLQELVDGIIFQATMPVLAKRGFWERLRPGRHRQPS